ncbi:toll/interleukin-1 receptor domain-containing protein [Algimonas ampicilliniresistens]|nr:toll/interleukin-1 receptor domain-containing protein [Algimonas ampicilliniresistens]
MVDGLISRVHGDGNILCYRGFSSFETTGYWMQPHHTYKAFISYSHHDRKWGSWLHRKLEHYPFPPKVLSVDRDGKYSPYLMRPIFRDREELTAGHDLGRKIEAALKRSEALIVICSPASAKSHWVNQEILYFKRHNRDARIFSVIVEGEPFSGGETECFPDALRYTVDETGALTRTPAEPLAADLRNIGDGKRLGLLKLLSGLANIGLDDLVQRDLRRSRQRVMTITLSALAIVIAMGSLLISAMNAREEADFRRNIAEEQIEFMLTDLKEEVKKVGRLDVLDVVIQRASAYYDDFEPTLDQPKAYERLSRVNMSLGEIALEFGRVESVDEKQPRSARSYFEDAYNQARRLYERAPDNADYVFNYAQAAYWLGSLNFSEDTKNEARQFFEKYADLAKHLSVLEPNTLRGRIEPIMADTNLAIWDSRLGKLNVPTKTIDELVSRFEAAYASFPTAQQIIKELAYAYAWQAEVHAAEAPDFSVLTRQKQLLVLQIALRNDPKDRALEHEVNLAAAGVAKAMLNAERYHDVVDIINNRMKSAERLWQLDRSNDYFLRNYVWLNYYLASAEVSLGKVKYARQRIEEIQRAKIFFDGREVSLPVIFSEVEKYIEKLELHASK